MVGGLEHFLFSHMGIITPIDFYIFQRGSNHQPVMHGEEMDYGSERIQRSERHRDFPRILENGAVEHVLEGAKSEVPCGWRAENHRVGEGNGSNWDIKMIHQ